MKSEMKINNIERNSISKLVIKIAIILIVLIGIILANTVSFASISINDEINTNSSRYINDSFDWESGTDVTGRASNTQRIIGAIMATTQIIFLIILFVCITNILIKIIFVIPKLKNELAHPHTESEEEREQIKNELNNKLNKVKNSCVISLITGIVAFFMAGVLEISTRFAKPVIYIYPQEDETEVNIAVSNPEKLTCTYPQYKNGWTILANKNGDLTDKNGRKYYSLYWEGKGYVRAKFEDGFCVKGEDTAKFLEEKLEILGLNEREAEEFIIYWLPMLEVNNYNLIRFMTKDEINAEMELDINPKPDTLIRIMMEFKPLKFKKEIAEQKLERTVRQGYTVVEWGGTKSK